MTTDKTENRIVRGGLTVRELMERLKTVPPEALVAVPQPGLKFDVDPATSVELGMLGGFAGRYSFEEVLILRIF